MNDGLVLYLCSVILPEDGVFAEYDIEMLKFREVISLRCVWDDWILPRWKVSLCGADANY